MAGPSAKELARFHALAAFDTLHSNNGQLCIAGVDEAGRGCLAGPVAAAAVILPTDCYIPGVDDSKALSENKRYRMADAIKEKALSWSVCLVSSQCIDAINILEASRKAMSTAVLNLASEPDLILIDALLLDDINIKQKALTKGDSTSLAIASASILAKVERDLAMKRLETLYPGYGFDQHKGYGTRAHMENIRQKGCTDIHRKSFEPIKSWLSGGI